MLGVSVKRVWTKATSMRLGKSAAFRERQNAASRAQAMSDPRMIAHRIKPGSTPWNAGLHYIPGGRCRENWFRKGNYSVRWDREAYAIGALRITKDGVLEIKLADALWVSMARYAWFLMTGAWPPESHVVTPKNGDVHDVQDENLECIHRRELIRRNSVWARYPPEYGRLVQLRGAITRQVRRIEREQSEHQ